jgi:hypothetical protein
LIPSSVRSLYFFLFLGDEYTTGDSSMGLVDAEKRLALKITDDNAKHYGHSHADMLLYIACQVEKHLGRSEAPDRFTFEKFYTHRRVLRKDANLPIRYWNGQAFIEVPTNSGNDVFLIVSTQFNANETKITKMSISPYGRRNKRAWIRWDNDDPDQSEASRDLLLTALVDENNITVAVLPCCSSLPGINEFRIVPEEA